MAPKIIEPTLAEVYGGVVMVSCAWIIMAYVFMPLGPIAGLVKASEGQQKWCGPVVHISSPHPPARRGKPSHPRRVCVCRGNRSFLNMQEQSVLFMASLWLYAVFCSASDATDLGIAYLVLRSMYPVLWMVLGGEGGPPPAMSMVSTFPQYAINLFEVVSVVLKVGYAADLKEVFLGYKTLGVFVFNIAFMSYAMGVMPQLQQKVFAGFFKKGKD